jgi:hypothetical protein
MVAQRRRPEGKANCTRTNAPDWPTWTNETRPDRGYSAIHGTQPQTLGYGLTDSPAGLAAWIGERLWTWTDQAAGGLSSAQMLDNISLYWLTGTATSSARLYWESIAEVSQWFTTATSDVIDVPTGCSVFPKEVPRPHAAGPRAASSPS